MDQDALDLVKRLRVYATKLRVPIDDRLDYATEAYLQALAAGKPEWGYAAVCLKHQYFEDRRNSKTRGSSLELHYRADDPHGDPIELQKLHVQPTQERCMEATQAVEAIDKLGKKFKDIMCLTALEYSREEIAQAVGVPVSEVRWRIALSRKILRQQGHDEIGAVRGHNKFVGIKRAFNKWQASIRDKADGYRFLGNFDTAAEAAKAYDEAAVALRGESARVNFPREASSLQKMGSP